MKKAQVEVPETRRFSFKTFFLLLIYACLIMMIAFLFYYIYFNLPGKPESLNVDLKKEPPAEHQAPEGEVKQFFPNMKFNHNDISYWIDSNCNENKVNRVKQAFTILSEKVPALRFIEVASKPDIEVSCSYSSKYLEKEEFFIAGEGGAKAVIPTEQFHIITEGIILLHKNPHNFKECEWPNIELHELIHVFGFNHSEDSNSLMYPFVESCEQELDSYIIERLNELYQMENLPDLYFEEVSASKRGVYLDFNITVKNAGLDTAYNASLSVLDEGMLVKTHELENITYGAGVVIEIENLKLHNRNSKEIQFVIDAFDNIHEIDKSNNIAKWVPN
jgi:hypothetical protein